MMVQTIVFGRTEGQIINKPDISGRHAKVTYLGDNMFEVEDLDSSNGTYVNGYRIKKSKISIKDRLCLSADTYIDLAKVFNLQSESNTNIPNHKSNPKDFILEFQMLKPLFDNYKNERKKIVVAHNRKVAIIRGCITVLPLGVVFIPGVNQHIIGASIVGSTIATIATSGMSSNSKTEDMDDDFRIRYVCPNPACNMQLGGISWNVYYQTGKCQRCGAIYNKEKL